MTDNDSFTELTHVYELGIGKIRQVLQFTILPQRHDGSVLVCFCILLLSIFVSVLPFVFPHQQSWFQHCDLD